MCGIFGGSALSGHKLNQLKLKTLGMFNRDRGKDSCGYYYNGHIEKGVWVKYQEDYSDFKNLLERSNGRLFTGDLDCEVFMGHTRKSTMGAHTIENAHPFVIEDNYVQTHNGKITNVFALKEKYGIKEYSTVDSKGLAMLIKKEGFQVLAEYEGFAALAMTFMHNPNSLYLFSGASRNKHDDESLYFERPLFYLEQPEGIYYSSMPESLLVIADKDVEIDSDGNFIGGPVRLPHNTVFEISEGKFTDWEYTVDRANANLKPIVKKPEVVTPVIEKANFQNAMPKDVLFLPAATFENENLNDLIKNDNIPLEGYERDRVYVKFARYYCNHQLLDGEYRISNEGYLVKEKIIGYDKNSEVFYFIKGIMLRGKFDYEKALEVNEGEKLENELNIAYFLSPFSKYPIFNLEDEAIEVPLVFKNKWYYCGKPDISDRKFTPKFSNKTYHIDQSKTVKILDDGIQIQN
jgi:hypothetical protein